MPLKCPACDKKYMTPLLDRDVSLEIDFCKSCKGLWFDDREIRRFLKSSRFTQLFLPDGSSSAGAPESYSITTRARACPRCLKNMAEHVHCGVAFDFCDKCRGIWLDDGEINMIIKYYRQGRTGGDRIILDELDAAYRGDPKAANSIFNTIANFFKDFFDNLK